jgi:hypothetical protein
VASRGRILPMMVGLIGTLAVAKCRSCVVIGSDEATVLSNAVGRKRAAAEEACRLLFQTVGRSKGGSEGASRLPYLLNGLHIRHVHVWPCSTEHKLHKTEDTNFCYTLTVD